MTNLKQVRVSRGLSQSQLANKSGLKTQVLQQYEQGNRNIDGAKLDTLIKLVTALECGLSDILENENLKNKLKKVRL